MQGEVHAPYELAVNKDMPEFRIVGTAIPSLNQYIDKVGKVTGWTTGVVGHTCVTIKKGGTNERLRCQDLVTNVADEGDSGSPVFTINPDETITLLGVLWGRITYFKGSYENGDDQVWTVISAVANIQQDLGSMAVTPPTTSSTTDPEPCEPQPGQVTC
jgi:hypothetical protein